MKKVLLLTFALMAIALQAQPIAVSTSQYSVPQLVNQVLINSTCVQATNISYRTGTHYNSVNGIGYFQNTNPNFPINSGVILSTGAASSAASVNNSLLNDGDTSWVGDADLEQILAQAGIQMQSRNATVLEFDFTPISSNFSFDFVFASEEYGNFQCQFSDAFAFLLTDTTTGQTTNLAVVPGTNLPISVVTIRDFLYNSSCPSANAQFFGRFNGGSAVATSANNFNGQTKLMTASTSALVPNRTYHIKLVIADRGDFRSDSAIFLSSNSLNIGQRVFGADLTVSAGTAVCYGGTQVLDSGLSASDYVFTWKRNGVVIPAATSPALTVTQPGTYTLSYKKINSTCDPIEDSILVEFYPEYTTPAPRNLFKCDTGAATYNYYLGYNTSVVRYGLNPAPTISYHISANDAANNVNPLNINYVSAPGQTIYMRIKNPTTGCFVIKSFQLLTTPTPVASAVPDQVKCEQTAGTGTASFNLYSIIPNILNGQSSAIYGVSFYNNSTDAQANTNVIPNSSNFVTSSRMIYAKIFNYTDTGCFVLVPIRFVVNLLPQIDQFQSSEACHQYVLPAVTNGAIYASPNGTGTPYTAGTVFTTNTTFYVFAQSPEGCKNQSSYTVTIKNEQQIVPSVTTSCGSYSLPAMAGVVFSSGPDGTGTLYAAGTEFTQSQWVYAMYTTNTQPVCTLTSGFQINVVGNNNVGTFENVFDCDAYTLPQLSLGNYYTGPNGTGSLLAAGTTLTQTQNVYVYSAVNQLNQHCTSQASFSVTIGAVQPADVTACLQYTLPPLAVGYYFTAPNGGGQSLAPGTVLTQSQDVYIYVPATGGVSYPCISNQHFHVNILQTPVDQVPAVRACDFYNLPVLQNGQYFTSAGGTGSQLNPGYQVTQSTTLFVRNVSAQNCANESSFTITILPAPAIDSRADIDVCNQYTLTPLNTGKYYSGINGTGQLIPFGTVLTQSQVIWIYAESGTTPNCVAQNSFTISVNPVHAAVLPHVSACGSYVLPALPVGSSYYTAPNGPQGSGQQRQAGDIITQDATMYIFAQTGGRINCTDESSFNIHIIPAPVLPVFATQEACNSYTLPALEMGVYRTAAGGAGDVLAAGTVLQQSQLVYVWATSPSQASCTQERSFQVNIHQVQAPQVANVQVCNQYALPALPVNQVYVIANPSMQAAITSIPVGTLITESADYTVVAQATDGAACYAQSTFHIEIVPAPVLPNIAPVTACREYTLPTLTMGQYFSQSGGLGSPIAAGTVLHQPQTIYVFAQTQGAVSCTQEVSFQLQIVQPELPQVAPVAVCDHYVLPQLPSGQRYFTMPGGLLGGGVEQWPGTHVSQSVQWYVYHEAANLAGCYAEAPLHIQVVNAQATPQFTDVTACRQYVVPTTSRGAFYTGTMGSGQLLMSGTTINQTQTLYWFDRTSVQPACYQERSFVVEVFALPSFNDVTTCSDYTLPALAQGQYFTGPNRTGASLFPGSVVRNTQRIYVHAWASAQHSCYDEKSFQVTITHPIHAAPVPASVRTFCDTDGHNDGRLEVTLSPFTPYVLGNQPAADIEVRYFDSAQAAVTGNQPLATSTSANPVYVRLDYLPMTGCYVIAPIDVIVHTLPEPIVNDAFLCVNPTTEKAEQASLVQTQLNTSLYKLQWFNNQQQLLYQGPKLRVDELGIYQVVATEMATGCVSAPTHFEVKKSSVAKVSFSIQEVIDDLNTIEIKAEGFGQYVYSLDDGDYQESPIFDQVKGGVHVVRVRDINGCGIEIVTPLVVTYPKFFTPNGDGINDRWNIESLSSKQEVLIQIYDRYGKLVTQVKPSGIGWDGQFNGLPVASDDYWFSVQFTHLGKSYEYKSHFALKR